MGDDHATALTSSPHGLVQHRGRGRDLAALQEQVIAKLGRQVRQSYTLTEKKKKKKTMMLRGFIPVATDSPHASSWDILLTSTQQHV